jgi:hypothetical protein
MSPPQVTEFLYNLRQAYKELEVSLGSELIHQKLEP